MNASTGEFCLTKLSRYLITKMLTFISMLTTIRVLILLTTKISYVNLASFTYKKLNCLSVFSYKTLYS